MNSEVQKQYAYLLPQKNVWVFILGSVGVHAGLVGLLILGGLLKDRQASTREDAKIVALLKLGKKSNYLPDKLPAPQAAPPENVRSQEAAQKDQRQSEASHKREPSKRDFSNDMNKALASLTQEGGRTKTDEHTEGSPDGVPEGDALIAKKGNEYATKIYKAVKTQYSVPEIITPKERLTLTAVVVIYLNPNGSIKRLEFEKKSTNSVFNSSVKSAILRAAPFPPPPRELADKYEDEGIGLEFDPGSLSR